MAARYHALYPQCPDFTGEMIGPTPNEQRALWLHNYTRAPGVGPRRVWHPASCTFERLEDGKTGLTHITATIDLDETGAREELAQGYRCETHRAVPILWARGSALTRRVQPLIDAHWEAKYENMEYVDNRGTRRAVGISIWYSRRPEPKTMHTAWTQLARP